jgi:hypothetical protein
LLGYCCPVLERKVPKCVSGLAKKEGKMARPERFRPPTFWFVAIAAQRINDLGRPLRIATKCPRWLVQQGSQSSSSTPSHSVGFGGGHKIGHSLQSHIALLMSARWSRKWFLRRANLLDLDRPSS